MVTNLVGVRIILAGCVGDTDSGWVDGCRAYVLAFVQSTVVAMDVATSSSSSWSLDSCLDHFLPKWTVGRHSISCQNVFSALQVIK